MLKFFLLMLLLNPMEVGPAGSINPASPGVVTPLCSCVEPDLLYFNYSFGGTAGNLTNLRWTPNGRVRFFYDATTGTDVTTSWTAVGTQQALMHTYLLVVGVEYTLYFQLDGIPDFPGYDESAWHPAGITWTQDVKESPIEGIYDEA